MQFWRAAHFITVGNWNDAIDIGYVELRSEFRTDQSVAESFIRWSDAYSAATTLPVNCGDSRLSLGCESFGREARYARARSVSRGPIQIETAAILYGRSSLPYLQPSCRRQPSARHMPDRRSDRRRSHNRRY